MRILIKIIHWFLMLVGLIVVSISIFVFIGEEYVYFTERESDARREATTMFEKACTEKHLNPNEFHGPERPNITDDEKNHTFRFVWTRNEGEEYWVLFPIYLLNSTLILAPGSTNPVARWMPMREGGNRDAPESWLT